MIRTRAGSSATRPTATDVALAHQTSGRRDFDSLPTSPARRRRGALGPPAGNGSASPLEHAAAAERVAAALDRPAGARIVACYHHLVLGTPREAPWRRR